MTGEARRAALVESAIREFGQYGPDGVSLETIARTAGVSRPALYQVFGSKDQLFAAAAEVESARFETWLLGAYDVARAEPPGLRARRRFAAVFAYAHQRPEGFRFLLRLRDHREGRIAEITRSVRTALTGAVAGQLREDFERSGLPTETAPDLMAALLLGLAESAVRWCSDHPSADDEPVIDLLTSFTIAGMMGCDRAVLDRVDTLDAEGRS